MSKTARPIDIRAHWMLSITLIRFSLTPTDLLFLSSFEQPKSFNCACYVCFMALITFLFETILLLLSSISCFISYSISLSV